MRYAALAAGCLMAATAHADTPVLTVYTYDSFVSDWGPGPALEILFEDECGCDVRFVAAGDGAALLARLKLEGGATEADVAVGLDTNLTAAAAESALFQPLAIAAEFDLPLAWDDALFLPYNWGYFAFVYDRARLADPPRNFEALAASNVSLIIQDPRSSTPVLGLLLWVKAAYGARASEIWAGLADNIVTVTPGWSEAYSLFLDGEADMVLSYTTSPAYHLIAEGDAGKAAALFAEGHYLQIEVAGKIASTDVPELADRFLAFLISDDAQSVLPTTNWMYPAILPETGLPEGFETLILPGKALFYAPHEARHAREEALPEWLDMLSR